MAGDGMIIDGFTVTDDDHPDKVWIETPNGERGQFSRAETLRAVEENRLGEYFWDNF